MSYILPFKQGWKVLELGGGEKPLLRPNLDFRKMPTVDIVHNLEVFPYPLENESFDGIFGKFIIEHISWRKVAGWIEEEKKNRPEKSFAGEIYRILKPGGLAVFISPNTWEQCKEIIRRGKIGIEENALLYGGQEGSWEETGNYHKAAFSPEYVEKIFKDAGFKTVKTMPLPGCHTDLIIEAYKGGVNVSQDPFQRMKQSNWYRELESKLEEKEVSVECKKTPDLHQIHIKLNIGSFTVMLPPPEWINLDILDLVEYAKQKGFNFQQVDVRKGLSFEDNSVEYVNTSHLLEHLEVESEGIPFLKECHRVLKEGGGLRVGVPDLRKLVDAYLKGAMNMFYRSVSKEEPAQPEEYLKAPSQADKFWRILTADHKTVYDLEALKTVLNLAGFTDVKEAQYDNEFDMFPELSIYVLAQKTEKSMFGASPDLPKFKREEEPYQKYLKGKITEGRQPYGSSSLGESSST